MYRTLCKRQVALLGAWLREQAGFLRVSTVACTLVLAACGTASGGVATARIPAGVAVTTTPAEPTPPTQATQLMLTPAPSPTTPTMIPSTPPPDTGGDTVPTEIINRAQNALAAHLGALSATLTLAAAEARDWPDTSLGCPAEGMAYLMVITPGYLLVFNDAAGQSYAIHTSEAGQPLILCQDGQPVELATTEEET